MDRLPLDTEIVPLMELVLLLDHLSIGDAFNANAPSCPIVAEQASGTASNCELKLQQGWPM
jgi:hypothetical protein